MVWGCGGVVCLFVWGGDERGEGGFLSACVCVCVFVSVCLYCIVLYTFDYDYSSHYEIYIDIYIVMNMVTIRFDSIPYLTLSYLP